MDRHGVGVQAREVEELVDETAKPLRLGEQGVPQLDAISLTEPVAKAVERVDDPVDARHRSAELVRCESDEVRLQVIGALERQTRLALAHEQVGAVERQAGQSAERSEEVHLLGAEKR